MLSLSLRALTILVSAGILNAALTPRSSLSPALGGLAANITGEDQTFDFVIIGGGTAGIPVAYRLSEDPSVRVALIEAGQFYEYFNAPLSSTPFGDLFGVGSEASEVNDVDWGFITAPFPGANNRDVHYARGKALGGSSARNFMIYQRPTKASMQMWADDVGDQSYNWDNFFPYFEKSVDFTPPDMSVRAANSTPGYNPGAYSSHGAPLQVSFPKYAQPFSSFMPGGFSDIGIQTTKDFNSGSLMGAQYTTGTIDPNGSLRASSQETFLTAAAARTNLKVFDMTMAKKIIFDDRKNAVGVQVNATGFPLFTIKATKEVILSAGALQSPQLLMVSGVGPQATLKALNIPVIHANENVGQNMWDHVLAAITYPIRTDSASRLVNDPQYQANSLTEWQTNGTGPFSNMNCDFLAWENVPENMRQKFTPDVLKALESFPSDWPEVEYLVAAGYLGDWASPVSEQPSSGNWGSVATGVVAPLSRGNVTIVSADVNDLPIINPNWLDHPADQAVIVAGYKRMRQLFASETVQKVVTGAENYPGSKVSTDDEILAQIKNSSITIWHAAATCKMGNANDKTAVVNPHASVIGVQNLRVVDASSFAILPPGHPQSVVYALAEKISDDIKSTWSLK